MPQTYDQSSYQLACDFLEDDERFRHLPVDKQAERKDALAKSIQGVVEDFLEYEI